jgi:RNA polymerase sigma-70 factor, ECF subfamily
MTFDELYDRHFDFVWRSLRRLGVPEADVSDIAQEVFLSVSRRLEHFEERAKVTTWLFKICMRAARDRKRRAHLRHELLDTAAVERAVDARCDSHAELEQRERLKLLEVALSAMSLEQRAAFTLFELEGMRAEDVAEALDLPLGTVYSRVRLARDVFRKSMARARARERSGGMT